MDRSLATFRLRGDDLAPDEISGLLGASPTKVQWKGQELIGHTSRRVRIAKTGSWQLNVAWREPENLEAQILEILDQLTPDLGVWSALSHFQPNMFCGIFMGSSNDGLILSAKALQALGERGIALELDVYGLGDERPDTEA
jgi:hypothetical protein